MPARNPKRLVLDTVVLQRAGTSNSGAQACADALTEIRDLHHLVVRTPSLAREWAEHKTRLMTTWLAFMHSRKRIVELPDEVWPELRAELEGMTVQHGRLAATKDLLLVEAAHQADGIILSCDERARKAYCRLSHSFSEIAYLRWVNPERYAGTVRWLRDGLPSVVESALCMADPA